MKYEYEYKNTMNMTEKDKKEFFLNLHKWFQKELKSALRHDPLLSNCYHVFQHLMQVEDPFETLEFLTMALYQALLSNSINFKQLVKAINLNPNPNPISVEVPKGSILLSDN